MKVDWVSGSDLSWLELKLLTLLVLIFISLMSGFTSLFFIRRAACCSSDTRTRHRVVSFMSCFASGVFLATCFLDVLPNYLSVMRQTFNHLGLTLHFPLPEFILAMGFLIVFVVEQILFAFREQSQDLSYETEALLEDCSIQSQDGPKPSYQDSGKGLSRRRLSWVNGSYLQEDSQSHVGLRVFLLMFCLCLRAVFEGLATGGQQDGLLKICVTLLLHKSVIAFSLAFKLTHYNLRRAVVAGCLVLFSVMCPMGIGFGLSLSETEPQRQLVYSAVEGLTSGTFVNITTVGLVQHELGSPKHRIHKVAFLLAGFAVVTAVLFIKV